MGALWWRAGQPAALLRRGAFRARRAGARGVERGQRVHFVQRELSRDDAHLLVDVVLAKPLGEGRELRSI